VDVALPGVEIVHIVGFVRSSAPPSCSTRACWAARGRSPSARSSVTCCRGRASACWLVVPTGALMFTAHATEMATNPALRLKLVLLVARVPERGHLPSLAVPQPWATGHRDPRPHGRARQRRALDRLWVGVIACGRLIAYF